MALFMTEDKKELIVTCKCGCMGSYSIQIEADEEYDYYAFICFLKSNTYTAVGPIEALKTKLKKIWCIIIGKDYCYSDTILSKADYDEFKKFINQF